MSSLSLAVHPADALVAASLRVAEPSGEAIQSFATPLVWGLTIVAVLALVVLDFALTHKPHDVSMKEAALWSAFYIALPVAFGGWVWSAWGSDAGVRYYSGYIVEKALSIDNLFVFIVILAGFAVPRPLRQRVLLLGVVGALVLRGIFIAVGAGLISQFSWIFFVFGLILLLTAIKVVRDALSDEEEMDPGQLPVVRLVRRFFPVTDGYDGPRMMGRVDGRRALTPLAVVVAAIMGTDVLFAVDSVPAVYGITSDPYLVFATNAFALLGLRALYFLLEGSLKHLRYLPYGLSLILGFIAVKLVLHGAHLYWPAVPDVPALPSLIVIAGILAVTIAASLMAGRGEPVVEKGVALEDADAEETSDADAPVRD